MTEPAEKAKLVSRWTQPWNEKGDGYGVLAQYVSTASLRGTDLQLNDADLLLVKGPRAVAAELFRLLADREYGYNLEPWNASAGQLIRDAVDIENGSGTCLDMALLFAAMAKHASLRPYVAIGHGVAGRADRTDHAFVVIDTNSLATDKDSKRLWDFLPQQWRNYYLTTGDQPFWANLDTADPPDKWPANWLVIDPTQACRSTESRPRDHDFDNSVILALDALNTNFDRVVLLDVVGAHVAGHPELPRRSRGADRAVLFRRVRQPVGYHELPSRRKLIGQLAGRSGYVVLAGAPGAGKSLTATLVATAAAGGAGWFLNAQDEATLRVELAEAAMSHMGIDPTGMEANDIKPYAALALEILSSQSARWVVVLDNANLDPDRYGKLPVPGPNQLVIVTTTKVAAWSDWVKRQSTRAVLDLVPDLTDAERAEWPGARGMPDPPATPLLLNLAVGLKRRGLLPGGRDTDSLVRAALAAFSPSALAAATALSLLPPVPALAVDLTPDPKDGPGVAVELADLGLVQLVSDDQVVMHRTIREAAAQHFGDTQDVADTLVRLLSDASANRRFEASTTVAELQHFAELLDRAQAEDQTVAKCFHALGSFQERRNSAASADWFSKAMARLPDPADVTSPEQAQLIASCLQGIARAAFRGKDVQPKLEARDLLTPVYELGARFPEDLGVQVSVSRADAMDALLRRNLADSIDDAAARRQEKLEALDQLERSAALRAELLSADSPDVDRSRFNIPGTLATLSKEARPEEVKGLLDRADDLYREIHRVRSRRYRTQELEEVITCVNGLAVVNLNRAMLQPDLTPSQRVALLERAHDQANEAREVRQRLAAPSPVSGDSAKSAALAAKALMLLQGISGAVNSQAAAPTYEALVKDVSKDFARIERTMTAQEDK